MSDKTKELQSKLQGALSAGLGGLKAKMARKPKTEPTLRGEAFEADSLGNHPVSDSDEAFQPLFADEDEAAGNKAASWRAKGAHLLDTLKQKGRELAPKRAKGGQGDKELIEPASPSAAKHGKGVIPILLHLENNREVVCLLKADGTVAREGEAEPGVNYLVFSAQDYRYRSPSVSHSKAMSVALEDQGQAVRLVNRSSELGAFYTRAQDAMGDYPVTPGGQLADWLLKSDGLAKSFPRVVGFSLGEPEGIGATLVVLYYYDDGGEVGRPQISINPQSLEFALSQFATSRKIPLESVPVTVYGAKEFRKAHKRAEAYLNEDLFLGKTRGTWIGYGVVASALALLGSVGAGGYYYTRIELAQRGAEQAAAAVRQLVTERKDLLIESTQSLGAAYALNGLAVLNKAEALWRPGFAIEVDTDKAGTPVITITASMPKTLAPEERKALLDSITTLKAPEGCAKDNLLITGGLSEAKVSIKCPNQSRAPDAYRPR